MYPGFLSACFCLDFDILNRPNAETIPYMTHVEIGVEPRDLLTFHRIFDGADPQQVLKEHGGRIEGLFQINGISPHPLDGPRLTQNRYDLWQNRRNELVSEGKAHYPVVVAEFCYLSRKMTLLHCLEISDVVKKIVKSNKPFRSISRRFGPIERPFNVLNCLSCVVFTVPAII